VLRVARRFSEKKVSLSPSGFMAHDPERDLNNEIRSASPDGELNESERDLKKEAFSTKPDAEPNEPPRYILRPLK
jgi:hypothetical protein